MNREGTLNNCNSCTELTRCSEGIKNLLLTIEKIQRAAIREELDESCDRHFLGGDRHQRECNTRPITFYTFNDVEWAFPIRKRNSGCEGPIERSCVFRVERVEDCCVTCRVLREINVNENNNGNEYDRYVATESLFTIDINGIAACRCLEDCYVELRI